MSKQKTSKQLFEEIYDLCAEQMDSGNYDSLLLEISSLANEGKDTTDQALNLHGVINPLNCPFCGKRPNIEKVNEGLTVVECRNDDCHVRPYCEGDDRADAVGKWYTRAI